MKDIRLDIQAALAANAAINSKTVDASPMIIDRVLYSYLEGRPRPWFVWGFPNGVRGAALVFPETVKESFRNRP